MAPTLEVLRYWLSVNVAARRWTNSSCFIPVSVYGSQTVWLYSSTARTNVLCLFFNCLTAYVDISFDEAQFAVGLTRNHINVL